MRLVSKVILGIDCDKVASRFIKMDLCVFYLKRSGVGPNLVEPFSRTKMYGMFCELFSETNTTKFPSAALKYFACY